MSVRSLRFPSGPLTLEGRLAEPGGPPSSGIILCHPHPLMRGSMSSALIPALQRSLVAAGHAVLRFNFRGVGRSEGSYDGGKGETDDALAALDEVSAVAPGTPLVAAGWSFGGLIALLAALRDERVAAVIAVAPPMGPAREDLPRPDAPSPDDVRSWPGRCLVVAGGRDELAPAAPIVEWAGRAGARAEVIEDAGHFFAGATDRLGALAADFLEEG